MIGYIYVTWTTDGFVYVGQHRKQKFDTTYFGSGVRLKKKQIMSCRLIDTAHRFDELDHKEQFWIDKYRERYGDKCLNLGRVTKCKQGLVFVHKRTNVVVVGLAEMKYIYKTSRDELRRIVKGQTEPKNGFYPDDWEILSYEEYDTRSLII
jgi:hypothetical protein